MKYFFKMYLVVILTTSTIYAANPSEVIIVMDASGSMYDKINEQLKINKDRKSIKKLLSNLNKGSTAGLEIMGGRKNKGCGNYRLAIPMQQKNHQNLLSYIKKIKSVGKTPMASALRQASSGFSYDGEVSNIVLVSDGSEKCGDSACSVAKELKKSHPTLSIDIISLATDKIAEDNLRCIAEATGGIYIKPEGKLTSKNIASSKKTTKRVKLQQQPTVSLLKIHASLPVDDKYAVARHKVYAKDGSLILECSSTNKVECTESIATGKYMVESSYGKTIHNTKLYILESLDAFLYTSFKSKDTSKDTRHDYNEDPRKEKESNDLHEMDQQYKQELLEIENAQGIMTEEKKMTKDIRKNRKIKRMKKMRERLNREGSPYDRVDSPDGKGIFR